jgi:hypothetical protein
MALDWSTYRGEPVAWTRDLTVRCSLNGRETGTVLVRRLYRADGTILATVPVVSGIVP